MLKLVTLALLSAGAMVAQERPEAGRIFFSTPDECLAATDGNFAVYAPHFTDNLPKWQKLVKSGHAELLTAGAGVCAEEWSMDDRLVRGWRIVRWPDNNPYFQAADGKMADGRCGNAVRKLWFAVPVPPPPPVETPVPSPCPCVQVVDVELPAEIPPVPLNPMPPELGPPPSYDYVATLVWDAKGKSWVWKYTPLWCIDVRKASDLYHPAVCAAFAVGGYWLAGGFKAAAVIKEGLTLHY